MFGKLIRCSVAQAAMGAFLVVFVSPFGDFGSGISQIAEPVGIQAFISLTLQASALFFSLLALANADTLTFLDGTSVTGKWIGADNGQVMFMVDGKTPRAYPRSSVSEVAFGNERPTLRRKDEVPNTDAHKPTVGMDQTIEQVESALGKPPMLFNFGVKKIYIYQTPTLKITFRDGKVTDIE